MAIVYRRAGVDDAPAASTVFAEAYNDLGRRHGFGHLQMTANPQNPFFASCVSEEPDGAWVAEDNGKVVGFSVSWMRGSFWFLAQLFVLPGYQGQGVGRRLLEKALAYGHDQVTRSRALITFAFNPAAISLYTSFGFYPREPLYAMAGDAAIVRARLEDATLDEHEASTGPAVLADLRRIDEEVLGFTRDRDHSYLSNLGECSRYLFRTEGVLQGYSYVWKNGQIGPSAARSPSRLSGVLASSLRLALKENPERVSILVGANEYAMATGLRHGLRITIPFLWMSSRPMENLACYLFRSPGFM